MRSIQTQQTFSLSSVKPLERLLKYRAYCLAATREAMRHESRRLERSPVGGGAMQLYGTVEGFVYLRCPDSGSLFLADRPDPAIWARLLAQVSQYRHSPEAFHADLTQSRTDHVYAPRLEWIEDALQLQELHRPRVLEVVTAPSDFTGILHESRAFSDVLSVDEMTLSSATRGGTREPRVQAAILLESLDRVQDPAALLDGIGDRLVNGGLVFVTAIVVSGFDMAVLGLRNRYLYPPDRANCFSLEGLCIVLRNAGFTLLEVSTPGVLDVEIVRAHRQYDPSLPLSAFEQQIMEAGRETHEAFQTFLQQQGLSSFARIVARKR